MKTKLIFSIFALALFITSCKKEVGPQGPAGTNGTNGTNGVANITEYDFAVTASQWNYNTTYQHWLYRKYITAPYGSVVLCYVMSGNGKQAMPWYNPLYNVQYDFADNLFQTNSYVELQYTNFTTNTTGPSYDENFYMIIIPRGQRVAHPGINYNNYSEVKKAFHLKD